MNNFNVIKPERNYGIDLLRIFAMFMVVVLHCLGQGGILNNATLNSVQYKFAWFMEICAYCAVNIFGLISGYVLYSNEEKKFNYSNYIKIWLQVLFYGLLVTFIFNLITPSLISKNDYIIALFPVTNGLYWYFTAYTGLFFIIPFLNKAIRNSSNESLKKLFFILVLVFSFFDSIVKRFLLASGYSFIWITLLYILGAIIKKCEIGKNLKWYKIFFTILILYLITYLYKIYGLEKNIESVKINITKDLLVSYTSPTILLVAILYLISFSRFRFNNFVKNLIRFSAPSAFSIYLLNTHRLVWKYLLENLFINISNLSVLKIFTYIMFFSILFVVITILIDKIRIILFKLFHVDALAKKINNLLYNILNKIIKCIK